MNIAKEETFQEVYDLGNGCAFIATRPSTVEAIYDSEKYLLEKADQSSDPKYERYNKRIKEDEKFRKRRAVIHALRSMYDDPDGSFHQQKGPNKKKVKKDGKS